MKAGALTVFFNQACHAMAGNGAARSHHPHVVGLAGVRRRFDCRFHANDRQIRHLGAQCLHGRSRGGVAGNHQNFDAMLLAQVLGDGQSAFSCLRACSTLRPPTPLSKMPMGKLKVGMELAFRRVWSKLGSSMRRIKQLR